jgi:RecA-family ATPase
VSDVTLDPEYGDAVDAVMRPAAPHEDPREQISTPVAENIASWRRIAANRNPAADTREMLRRAKDDLLRTLEIDRTSHPEHRAAGKQAVFDALYDIAEYEFGIPTDEAQAIFAEKPLANGHSNSREGIELNNKQPPDDGWQPPTEIPDNAATDAAADEQKKDSVEVKLVTPADWPDEQPVGVEWLAFQRIPRGDVSTIHGDGGSGKTDGLLQLASACARGAQDWFGAVIQPGPSIFLSVEEPEQEIRRRLHRLGERDGYDPRALKDLHFWFPDDLKDCALAAPDKTGIMQPRPLFEALEKKIAEIGPVLVVLDNVAATYIGEQIGRVHARTFTNLFRGIARGPSRPAVVLLDHPSLSGITNGTGRGGNMDWRNGVRGALYLRYPDDRAEADAGVRILEVVKSNYGPIGEKVKLQWVKGGLAVQGTPSALQQATQDSQADEKFLELLALHNRLGIDVGYSTGRNYAPKIFADHPDSGGYKGRVFATAMQRLLGNKIELEAVGPKSKGKKRLVVIGGQR